MTLTRNVRERPILFSDAMVRAILDGAKTQTRRIAKTSAVRTSKPEYWQPATISGPALLHTLDQHFITCPYGKVGDRLWVREAWGHDGDSLDQVRAAHEDVLGGGVSYGPYYRATEVAPDTLRWRPSIHMPRWACRITLEVTDVRVQRLQSISEIDARAEGITEVPFYPDDGYPLSLGYMVGKDDKRSKLDPSPIETYARLWGEINGVDSWAANPWVWALTFKRVDSDAKAAA